MCGYLYDSFLAAEDLRANGGSFTLDSVLPQFGQHLKSLMYVGLKDYTWFYFMDFSFQAPFLGNVTIEDPDMYVFAIEHL